MSGGLAKLQELDMAQLRNRWEQAYGAAPPARLGKDVLLLALGWRAQAKNQNGLSPETRACLSRLVTNLKAGRDLTSGATAHTDLSPGMSLIREWKGTIHQVLVLENGFGWDGKVWRSLSRIAREITGARWNGPAFFGLRSKRATGKRGPA